MKSPQVRSLWPNPGIARHLQTADRGVGKPEASSQFSARTKAATGCPLAIQRIDGLLCFSVEHIRVDLGCPDRLREGGGSLLVRNGKGGKRRLVRFGAELSRSLLDYMAWKEACHEQTDETAPLIISSHTGGAVTVRALQMMFARIAKQAGVVGHRFHDLRHCGRRGDRVDIEVRYSEGKPHLPPRCTWAASLQAPTDQLPIQMPPLQGLVTLHEMANSLLLELLCELSPVPYQ